MDFVKVRRDYARCHDYRLLTIDRDWLSTELQDVVFEQKPEQERPETTREEQPQLPDDSTHPAGQKRARVCLVLRGGDQLHVHSRQCTDLVRRVEYSNTLLVASRRTQAAPAAQTNSVLPSSDGPESGVVKVVQAALSRVFETHKGVPQTNVLALLSDSYVTIDELEGTVDDDSSRAVSTRHYTFNELAHSVTCSPAELVTALKASGAVVLHGKVRLLHPALLHDALRACLVFLDGTTSVDVSWQDVAAHLCPSVYPPVVLQVVQAVYGACATTSSDKPSEGIHCLVNATKALVALAGHVFETLAETVKHTVVTTAGHTADVLTLPFDVFYEAWKNRTPNFLFSTALPAVTDVPVPASRLTPEDLMPLLFGYAVCEQPNPSTFVGAHVHWLPKDILTTNVSTRIDILFAVKPQKWSAAELKAYIVPLLIDAHTFTHTVARYAREYRIPGQPVAYARLVG